MPRRFPVDTRHQQFVERSVDMPHRRRDGQPHRFGIERPSGRATSDPAAAAGGRVAGDRLGPAGRAVREQRANRGAEFGLQTQVLVGPSRLVALPAAGAHLRIGEALVFGALQRLRLDQDALTLVSLTRPAPPHHHRRKPARPLGPAGKRGVPGRQEDQMAKVRAVQAQRPRVLKEHQVTAAATRRA
ncbi:Uncharacterised protein [Mycobacterium tuberculosis]|nr:Uncharacterised protein [Mycobacterium tuberculosis]